MGTLLLNPIVFSIGSLSVRWYGLILGAGALVGLLLAIREETFRYSFGVFHGCAAIRCSFRNCSR